MKKICLLSACISLLYVSGFSQTSTQRIFIKGGNNAWENYMKEIFLYPSFETGIVEYRNGKRLKGNMNYNKVLGTIVFIDERGDTLAITDEPSINSIVIGNDLFLFNPECLQSVRADGKIKLLKNERIRIADKQKTGSYGIPNSTSAIESVSRSDRRFDLDVNEDLLLSKVTSFYMEDDENHVVPASKKNILMLFAKHEASVKAYIKANNIDFTSQYDLVQLTGYLSQL